MGLLEGLAHLETTDHAKGAGVDRYDIDTSIVASTNCVGVKLISILVCE